MSKDIAGDSRVKNLGRKRLKNKNGILTILLITLTALTAITFWYFLVTKKENAKNEIANREITEIVYGEVYSFIEQGTRSGYIKFIDEESYLAMPSTKSPEASFGDAETYDIIFIEGKCSFLNEKFYLGESVKVMSLSFYDQDSLDKNSYDEIFVSTEPNLTDFENGSIEQNKNQWVYRRKINDIEYNFPLERSKKDIPNSTNEFLKKYKKADTNRSSSE